MTTHHATLWNLTLTAIGYISFSLGLLNSRGSSPGRLALRLSLPCGLCSLLHLPQLLAMDRKILVHCLPYQLGHGTPPLLLDVVQGRELIGPESRLVHSLWPSSTLLPVPGAEVPAGRPAPRQ